MAFLPTAVAPEPVRRCWSGGEPDGVACEPAVQLRPASEISTGDVSPEGTGSPPPRSNTADGNAALPSPSVVSFPFRLLGTLSEVRHVEPGLGSVEGGVWENTISGEAQASLLQAGRPRQPRLSAVEKGAPSNPWQGAQPKPSGFLRLAWATLSFTVVLNAASLAVRTSTASRCTAGQAVREEQGSLCCCNETLAQLGGLLGTLTTGVTFALSGYLYFGRLAAVAHQESAARSRTWLRRCLRTIGVGPELRAGSWTLAASPRILLETCRQLQHEMSVLFCFFFLVSATVGVAHAVAGPSPSEAEYYEQVCSQASAALRRPCSLAFHAMWPSMIVLLGLGLMMIFLNIGAPRNLWSPVVQQALRQLGPETFGIRALILLPWLTVPGMSLATLLTVNAYMYQFQAWGSRASPAGVFTQVSFIALELIYMLAVVACMLLPGPWAARAEAWRRQGSGTRQARTRREEETEAGARSSASRARRLLPQALLGKSRGRWAERLVSCTEVSVRHRRKTFMLLALFVWSIESSSAGTVSPLAIMLWLLRVVFLVLYFAAHDADCSFAELERQHDPGFGLLVGALQLRRALEAALVGRESTGPLKTYKGSIWRMRDTMAVSYRWQAGIGVVLKDGLAPLNMSHWQMATLASALRASHASYVWIDCLSVPQVPCQLQRTLLARMMAVYAGAEAGTISLRSHEAPGGRYHQRAWTLQEFCCATALSLHTQGPLQSAEPQAPGMDSVCDEEDLRMLSVRKWHLARLEDCLPVWVDKDDEERFSGEQRMRAIVLQYQTLAAKVFCTVEEDKLRALFPLVANAPVEDQQDLVHLISRVHEGARLEVPQLMRALKLVGSDTLAQNLANNLRKEDVAEDHMINWHGADHMILSIQPAEEF